MKKIFRMKGFTVAEVLVATAILAIFVSMAIVGTSALFGTGEQMMAVSKAAVLGSDAMKVITNEIRFGEKFSLTADEDGTKKIGYNSTTYGDGCTIGLEGGKLIIVQTPQGVDESGVVIAGEPTTFYPIGTAAYDEVYIKAIEFDVTTDEKTGQVTSVSCTLTVTDGEHTLWEKTAQAAPLYLKAQL